jgi:hypothetical protein
MKLKVTGFAPGSDTQGADASSSNLITKEIEVKIYAGSEVETCEQNTLYPGQTTFKDNEPRDFDLIYEVPAAGAAEYFMNIPALQVTSSLGSSCKTITYAQRKRENCSEDMGQSYCWEEWVDIVDDDYVTTHFGENELNYLVFSMSQDEFIDAFEWGTSTTEMEQTVDLRFVSYDPTNEWQARHEDYLTLTIRGNG